MKLIQRSLHVAYIFPPVVNILRLQGTFVTIKELIVMCLY